MEFSSLTLLTMYPFRVISQVPKEIFDCALTEISTINWMSLPFKDTRSQHIIFNSSRTLHLRVHNALNTTPHTIKALSEIIDCVDTPIRSHYPSIGSLINWVFSTVEGTDLGRIMVVNLLAGGNVKPHIDPGSYFKFYYRFHVPMITLPNVTFQSEDGTNVHMPKQHLSQLYNLKIHGVNNNSHLNRIHLILDIRTSNLSFKY